MRASVRVCAIPVLNDLFLAIQYFCILCAFLYTELSCVSFAHYIDGMTKGKFPLQNNNYHSIILLPVLYCTYCSSVCPSVLLLVMHCFSVKL